MAWRPMLKKNSFELLLVIPIFRGGDLFMDALRSVERSDIRFNKIIVSFNGVGDEDINMFTESCRFGELTYSYTVFKTGADLSGNDHGKFMLDKLKKITNENSLIFFLAHDDRILRNPESDETEKFLSSLDPNSVYFPSYSCCQVQDYSTVIKINESEESIPPEIFFWRTQRENVPTSMSGIIAPLMAWNEAAEVMTRSGSGARFEHLLAIARPVKLIHFHKHPGQTLMLHI